MIRLRAKNREVVRLGKQLVLATSHLEPIGVFLVQQVKDRFTTQGASGGTIWPPRRADQWGASTGRAILTGRTGRLLASFKFRIHPRKGSVVVYSDLSYSMTHQLGTVGKGGELPTIVPKRAKALFIPITDRAAASTRFTGPEAAFIRHGYGMEKLSGPIRSPTGGRRRFTRRREEETGWEEPEYVFYQPLRPGKLVGNKLYVRTDDGEYEPGIPDFIFLAKVDIPPRPMLPTSTYEQVQQRRFIATTMKPGKKT